MTVLDANTIKWGGGLDGLAEYHAPVMMMIIHAKHETKMKYFGLILLARGTEMNPILENYLNQADIEEITIDFSMSPPDEEHDLELDELLHESEWLEDDTFTFNH